MAKLRALRAAGLGAGMATLIERRARGELSTGVAAAAAADVVRVEGLSQELPLGTEVRCEPSGEVLVLGWRRGFDCVCVATGGAAGAAAAVGDTVDFAGSVACVAAGAPLRGADVAPLAAVAAASDTGTADDLQAVINNPPDAESRRPIDTPLVTGVKAVDMLLPLGEGQSVLVAGAPGSGLGAAAACAAAAQAAAGVHVVVACCGAYEGAATSAEEWRARVRAAAGPSADAVDANLTVVHSSPDAGAGERYLCAQAACAVAEGSAAAGDSTLVVLDDAGALSGFWKAVSEVAPAELNVQAKQEVQEGDEEGAKAVEEMNSAMVQVAGMLVSKEAAERRGIFSSLLQRAACLSEGAGGGEISLVAMACEAGAAANAASGREAAIVQKQIEKVMAYETITDEQKERMVAALREKLPQDAAGGGDGAQAQSFVSQEVSEEIKSISDGHVVLEGSPASDGAAFTVDLRGSLVRIGSRAALPTTRAVASRMRLELVQTLDELEYSASGSEEENLDEGLKARRARLLAAVEAMHQNELAAGVDRQALVLWAIDRGLLDGVATDDSFSFAVADAAADAAARAAPEAAAELAAEGAVDDEAAAGALESAFRAALAE
eukprot:PRCOL_00005968-RA